MPPPALKEMYIGKEHLLVLGMGDLNVLYQACEPAAFGRNEEIVLDNTFRKAKKMDPGAFATSFDPHSTGIVERVTKGLLVGKHDQAITEIEPCKLNVYGEGDFFKSHKDAPRDETTVGTLVVVLPARHQGGQLVLRQDGRKWTLDFAATLAAAVEPMVCFVAFFGDVEHEVLPVTSGYRVTLTYKLHRKSSHRDTSYITTPFHGRLKKALVELINDKSTLPDGGYLGSGLVHEYAYNPDKAANVLLDQLKGADQILAIVCEELGLKYSLRLLYRELGQEGVNLIAKSRKDLNGVEGTFEGESDYLRCALEYLTIDDIEGVEIIGQFFNCDMFNPKRSKYCEDLSFLEDFYSDPVTKILEIRSMSSVRAATPLMYYGDQPFLSSIYGRVSMLISIDPVASRKKLGL